MNINSLSAEINNSSSTNSPVNNSSNQGEERDMFMSLLVAQLKNQDPLAPQEGTEFVAQLAQFNSLDQLISIRESIERLTLATQQTRGTAISKQTSLQI